MNTPLREYQMALVQQPKPTVNRLTAQLKFYLQRIKHRLSAKLLSKKERKKGVGWWLTGITAGSVSVVETKISKQQLLFAKGFVIWEHICGFDEHPRR